MARPVDMTKKIEELRSALQKYNGIPSQTVDKKAYSQIKYFINHYSDSPEIRELIDFYNLDQKKKRQLSQPVFEKRLLEIISILEKYHSFPRGDMKDYNSVYSFFKANKERPEVRRLMFLYPYPESYAMVPEVKVTKAHYTNKVCIAEGQSVFNYILYVYKQYHELPKVNTEPMVFLRKAISHLERGHNSLALLSFLNDLTELGCEDRMIHEGYGMANFLKESNLKIVNQEIIKNGACSIKYLSDHIVPGVHVSETFIYNYYKKRIPIKIINKYSCNIDNYSNAILLVKYQDYALCDVESIRSTAIKHYRDWETYPPITSEEWKYWGCCNFFMEYSDNLGSGKDMIEFLKTSKSFPEYCFENTIAYFDGTIFDYYKYIFFLNDKGYRLKQNGLTLRIKDSFDYNWRQEHNIREIEKLKNIFSSNEIL